MRILLYDTSLRSKFFPLTQTKAVADLRFGLFTVKERWERLTSLQASVLTESYLQPLYSDFIPGEYILIDSCVMPSTTLVNQVLNLSLGEHLVDSSGFVAGRFDLKHLPDFATDFLALSENVITIEQVQRLEYPLQICEWNAKFISQDFALATKGKSSPNNYDTVQFINSTEIFIEEGAMLSFCILNATDGPIYICKDTTVMEGCLIRGPFGLGHGSTLKMGARVYGGTTIGPSCVVGGEIKNSVISGYSNKAHDGYLGDSVIGEWCNLGAGTSNSNIKNNGTEVRVWNHFHNDYINAGIKAGVVMGDYSRTSINTSINTGAVVGVCCNVFGDGLSPKFIPEFSWGTKEGCKYEFEKAVKDITNWKRFKGENFSIQEEKILRHIFENNND